VFCCLNAKLDPLIPYLDVEQAPPYLNWRSLKHDPRVSDNEVVGYDPRLGLRSYVQGFFPKDREKERRQGRGQIKILSFENPHIREIPNTG